MKQVKKLNTVVKKEAMGIWQKVSIAFFALVMNFCWALPVLAAEKEPSAQGLVDYVLSKWVAPIFTGAVVIYALKEGIAQKFVKCIGLIALGAVGYFFIKDPSSFLDSLVSIPTKMGF
ncbi:TcpD family membrane protein [Enterococcus faecalis]|nr:TcpD family membrane protein [Enterococcus faecalis]MDU8024870.1 TcpD family membrane protein [Enterococcus faecalis]